MRHLIGLDPARLGVALADVVEPGMHLAFCRRDRESAAEDMRRMLATFIERLASMTDATSTYHTKMEESARLMEQAKSLDDIRPVLKEVIFTTRNMATDMASARDELRAMRNKISAAEADISKPEFRKELAAKIRDGLNALLTKYEDFGGIEEVYFTQFVVQ